MGTGALTLQMVGTRANLLQHLRPGRSKVSVPVCSGLLRCVFTLWPISSDHIQKSLELSFRDLYDLLWQT